jgi:uncharacterized OB-fold protein
MTKPRVPALGAEGWFTEDADAGGPALVGNRCMTCATVFFPAASFACRFAIAAVELPDEGMVVLGQVAGGYTIDDLRVGGEVELVVETLFEDDDNEYRIWRWKPAEGTERGITR